MPGCEPPVHFSRSAPFNVEPGQLMFYDVIGPAVMARSSVLSCIAEADGAATLPGSVTVSEFRKWAAAVSDSDAVFRSRPFASMCTIIKVADAVDDSHLDDWVRIAAQYLVQESGSIIADNVKEDVSAGLGLLTAQLQHRLFSAASSKPGHLDLALPLLPKCAHRAVLAATITQDKTLHLRRWLATCLALESLPSSPPPVLSLHITDNTDSKGEILRLGQAFQHCSGVSSLSITSICICPTSQDHLFAAIARLIVLRSLDLTLCMLQPDSAHALQQTLCELPQLQGLSICLPVAGPRQKRHRDASVPDPLCLAAMLSAATALTSLEMRDMSMAINVALLHARGDRGGCFTVVAPLRLPHLAHLTMALDVDTALAASFLSQLHAPLTSLTLSEALRGPLRIPSDAAAAAGRLLHCLPAFPRLRVLNAVLPRDTVDTDPDFSVRNALTAALPAMSALRELQSVGITAEPALAQLAVPLLTTTALTQLRVAISSGAGAPFTPAWSNFFDGLSHFELMHLDLQFQARRPEEYGIAALSSLTQLTALSLRGWSCVTSAADWQALAAMTALQQLSLHHRYQSFAVPPDCLASLQSLGALTALTLVSSEADEQLVPNLARRVPPQTLPALQGLTLSLYDPYEAADAVVCYAAMLPALTALTVHLGRSERAGLEDTFFDEDSFWNHLEPVGQRYSAAAEALTKGAAVAGLSVTVQRLKFEGSEI